ncbi:hypothetical protein [Stutzerimonas stutzeri]|uniref:hypothetical protein n=1 Tax=Stutzerimonas stutzeri TaxID=316 RepID=UPI000837D36D|nr:hypothetical protein [Stutzerimonas stutzeri]OCX57152.1 hypothetical protein BFM99_13870 [Stutzerimonas stutzeri]
MTVYEITAAGFDGGSSITEDRVIWVKTFDGDGAKEDLQIMCDEADAEFCGELPGFELSEDETALDFDLTTGLTAYGELRAVLGYFNRRRADA